MSKIREDFFDKEIEYMKKGLKNENDLVIKDFIPHIRDIIKTFGKQGHSGGFCSILCKRNCKNCRKCFIMEAFKSNKR